ncbi:hypothetical protein QBC32DRAFT_213066 [Pseudoneurospora amorphoporcata]|uniref:Uncharacterized protein n=1 Tax=Pseudoneurospora amorphoporcata TaxID=241081 RepID=A0AAN6NUM9_9PEZI|nr:hypothetical protein QBC32DRAFT_213066 [Pseudoneurospora amorphoporcata]
MADPASHTPRLPRQLSDDGNDADARLSPTQPLSSSSRVDGYYGDDVSTASDTDDHAASYRLDLPSRTVQAAWVVEGVARHIPNLDAELHIDTEQRTALITLRGQCVLKTGPSTGTSIFLFIYPENIQSVEFAYTPSPTVPALPEHGEAPSAPMNRFIRLRFILIKPPTLVAPKNQPLEPKGGFSVYMDGLQSLATVKDLSIYFDALSLVGEAREQLALLPSIFSRSRLETNEKRASLLRLYRGDGGQVVNPTTTASEEPAHSSAVQQEAQPGSPTHATTSGELQDAAQVSTPTQTRKRAASSSPSPSAWLPRYINREDERALPGPSNDQTEMNAPQSQESTQPFTPSDHNSKRSRLTATTPSENLASSRAASPRAPSPPPPFSTNTALDTIEVEASSTVDPQKLSSMINQLVARNAALEKRVRHLEEASASASQRSRLRLSHSRSHRSRSHHSPRSRHSTSHNTEACHQNCRYNTSEASGIRNRIDEAVDGQLDVACSRLEDWAHLEFPEQVRAEITGQLEDLGRDLGREWKEDIRNDAIEQVKEELKNEVAEETARDVLRKVGDVVVDAVGRSGWLGSPGGGSGGRTGSAVGNNLPGFGSNLPGDQSALSAAVADIQRTFAVGAEGGLSEEEMARVMDHLEENPRSVVKYNACGEGMKRFFVGKWKVDTTAWRGRDWMAGLR